jgi:hypothetical protein
LNPVSPLPPITGETPWEYQVVNDKKFFLTTTVGARIRFGFETRFSKLGILFWNNAIKGDGGMGKVACWVEGIHNPFNVENGIQAFEGVVVE